MDIKGKTIILGVSGGIAAYKSCELARLLIKKGATVHIVMTKGATNFITPLTFQALTGNTVHTDIFKLDGNNGVNHVNLAALADIMIIAPATANIIGKIASGIADDMLSTVLISSNVPVLIAPAMNCHMYDNPIVQHNIDRLKSFGYHFVGPNTGDLACGYDGRGRMSEPEEILSMAERLKYSRDLAGEKFVVTAGPTYEPIDPVRFIGNRSSGKMGYAIARAALFNGAEVVLISGPSSLPPPACSKFIKVETAEEMREATRAESEKASVLVMAAAVSDFKPLKAEPEKIKKGKGFSAINLEPTPDIISEIGRLEKRPFLVGFAAETGNIIAHAEAKLKDKGLDMIVANEVNRPGSGFGCDTNIVTIIDNTGYVQEYPIMSKDDVASTIIDRIVLLKSASINV